MTTETKQTTAHPPREAADGTQAIRRAASILKAVAAAGSEGASLAEIARGEDLARSTAHRILKCLVDEALLEQPEGAARYLVGPLVQELALSAPGSAVEVARWRPAVDNIARRTGVTTYLMRRSGVEAVCLHKADGHTQVRVIPVEVGQRRPLGVGAGATALLAALDEATCNRFIDLIAAQLAYPHITKETLQEAVRRTRKEGFAVSQGRVLEQAFGMGMVVPDRKAAPSLAISIAALLSSVKEPDIKQWAQIIREEIANAVAADGRT